MDPHKKPNKHQPATKPPKQPVASWADRVKVMDSNTRFTLDSIPQQEMGSNIEVTEDMLAEHAEKWNRSLVGFFPGYRMNFFTVNKIASRVWKPLGLEAVTTTASGFIIFQFQKEDQMHEILERGPWLFGGKAIILQPWHPHFVFDKNRISKLPVWVRLRGLPFPLWSRRGLSLAASMVGRPLSCDEATFSCTRLDFARVCVEIDAARPLVHNFDINTPLSPDPLHIEVDFEWIPTRCNKCHLFGHSCKAVEAKTPVGADSEKAVKPAEESSHIATRQCPLNENHEGTSSVQEEVQHGSDQACTVSAITKTKESNAMVKTTVARGKEVTTTTGIQHEPAVKKNTKGQGPVVREKGVMEVPVKHKEQEGNGEKQPKGGTSSQVEKPVRCTDNEMACLKSQSSIADEESSVGWETSSLAFIKVKNKKSAKKKGKEARCL
ncbi:GLYCINE-RICH CELL WALL STRUCTURAL PROTEIN 1.8-LIKE [Salix viminalis]|uniref:GLYCINE-RICH CELL WALL STRUCTURAL PROTEIN 1.8-LIKE n=1 Tax=Salix viminalis TaxID=40686 RepID=A0A9Q0QIC4_SALVM|nr:GLYCINE-RICH CELL WALL STRUCTURAL PROTEIN 1.8-LIKE [Salix viminalis]